MSFFRSLRPSRLALLLALVAAILGGKFLLIARDGSDLPFWDQWDAEGDHLLRPWVEGRLTVPELFAAHNEHRIFFTRVLALGLFSANQGQWDARLEMTVNAGLHAGLAILLALLALELLPALGAWAYAGAVALCFTAPAAWENTLGGFQSQFYFLLLFSALHLAGTLAARPRSWSWWLAPWAGLAAILSMGSGAISAAAIAAFLGLRAIRDRRLSGPDRGMLIGNAALLVAGGLLRVAVAGHEALQASGLAGWLRAAVHELSWPAGQSWAALLAVLPLLALARAWWRRRVEGPGIAVLLGAGIWAALQILALAYARGRAEAAGFSSRYTDLLAMGWLINLLMLGVVLRAASTAAQRRLWTAILASFAVVGIAGLSLRNAESEQDFLRPMPGINHNRLAAVRGYLASHNPAPFDQIPLAQRSYPDSARLAALLDTPALSSILPADAYPTVRPSATLSLWSRSLVRHGPQFLEFAAVCTALGLFLLVRRPGSARPSGPGHALAAVLPLLGGLILGWVLLIRLDVLPRPAAWQPPAVDRDPVPGFAVRDSTQPAAAPASFEGGIYPTARNGRPWFGTYLNGDGYTGKVVSTPFVLAGARLHVPLLGFPSSSGDTLTLEILNDRSEPVVVIPYDGSDPRETAGAWDLSVLAWTGRKARLVLVDASSTAGGWLAVGVPSLTSRGPVWLDGVPRTYGWFLLATAALAALLFLPGFALATWFPGRRPRSAAFAAIPGLLLLAVGGLATWIGGIGAMDLPADLWLGGGAVMGGAMAVRWWRDGAPLGSGQARHLGVYACVVAGALAFGILPLEVAQEFAAGTTGQARMIASPPHQAIPYRTAAYFYQGRDSLRNRIAYFGEAWSAGSRGPLAPLAITAGLVLLREAPENPPVYAREAWPASQDGFYIARILGILTNTLVILGGAALAARLLPSSAPIALVWLSVAPVTMINADFLWPKLLAIFFVTLAAGELIGPRRLGPAAAWTALAYLSHPVGGLMAGPLICLLAFRPAGQDGHLARHFAWSRAIGFAVLVALLVGPWLIYKHALGQPDVFLRYPWGDGDGFRPAASAATWLTCRVKNLWFSVIPGSFYFSSAMLEWLRGPLSSPLRWAIGYAKSLPGELGLGLYVIALVAVARRPRSLPHASYRLWLLAAAGAFMLLFWGYSDDGLGRNCLEPLAILLIVYAAGAFPAGWAGWRWLLALTAAEALTVRGIGLAGASSFSRAAVGPEALALGGIALVAAFLPALAFSLETSPSLRCCFRRPPLPANL